MKNPMDLKDLPNYIKSLQENGDFGDAVVGVGQIVGPKPIFRKFALVVALCFILMGFAAYNSTQEITIVAKGISSQDISNIVSDSGAQIVTIEQNEDTYKVRVFSLRLSSFIEKLRKNQDIEVK